MQRKSNAGTLQRRGGAQPAFMSRGYSGKRTPVAEARRGDGWAAERRATAPADLPGLPAPSATCPSGTCSVSLGSGDRGHPAESIRLALKLAAQGASWTATAREVIPPRPV